LTPSRDPFPLIREVGIVYRSPQPPPGRLYPFSVKRSDDGFVAFYKSRDARALRWLTLKGGLGRTLSEAECPALSRASTMDCDRRGNIYLLSEREGRLSILDPVGREWRTMALDVGARPIAVRCMPDGRLLVGTERPGGIFLLDRDARVEWSFRPGDDELAVALSVLPHHDGFCVADAVLQRVVHVGLDGRLELLFGTTASPGYGARRLSNPVAVEADHDGGLLICDSRNHRILKLDDRGEIAWELPANRDAELQLRIPWSILPLGADGYLVADTYNFRLLHLSPQLALRAELGATPVDRRVLSFPRSVQWLSATRSFLVADTYNNRIVELDGQSTIRWQFGGELPRTSHESLFWPRKVEQVSDDEVLIADSRDDRLLWVSRQGAIVRELTHISSGSDIRSFDDPHDFLRTPDNQLIIADSGHDRVVRLGPGGECVWESTTGQGALSDPHHVSLTADGRLLVTDTGNNRVAIFDSKSGRPIGELTLLGEGGLREPRACYERGGLFWILDSGNSRVLAVTHDEHVVHRWDGSLSTSPLPQVYMPRWFSIVSPRRMLVSDYFNARIVELELPA
jgi:DNA-binding beta-propeller fold protein YncE